VRRGHRRAARLTLEQLAGVSGVSARTLSDTERGRTKRPQQRTVTARADALALAEDARKEFFELARDGRLRDHWTRPAGLCELPRLADDFTGRTAELAWMSGLAYAGSPPGASVVGIITSPGGMGKTTLAVRGAHALRPGFPGGVFFLDLLGMSPQPMAADDALRLLLRALGAADGQVPGDLQGRASLYRSLLRDRRPLIILDNAGSEEQVRPLLPGDSPARALITSRRLQAGLEGVRRLALGSVSLPEARELLTGILGERAASVEEPALTRLAELCERLPLALRITGNRLVSRPGWDAAELAARLADEERRLDQFKAGDLQVASAFAMSYERSRAGCRPARPGTPWTSSSTSACGSLLRAALPGLAASWPLDWSTPEQVRGPVPHGRERSWQSGTPCRWPATSPAPARSSTASAAPPCWSATPTAAPSSPRPASIPASPRSPTSRPTRPTGASRSAR
jgi:transcriptional regulator with XRE-family HTH domain